MPSTWNEWQDLYCRMYVFAAEKLTATVIRGPMLIVALQTQFFNESSFSYEMLHQVITDATDDYNEGRVSLDNYRARIKALKDREGSE